MPTVATLQQRMTDIGESLRRTGNAYALLGLGSAGRERERMDEHSDLDFFAIVKEGHKQAFIEDLSWLSNISPAGYAFRNTVDGYKFLYEDGVFCEFAVFEPQELATIPFSEGQVIWAEDGFDTQMLKPTDTRGAYHRSDDVQWIIGEALTNLYVGLCRFQRGEILSAMKFVQSFALDRIIDLLHIQQPNSAGLVDRYMPDRRVENRLTGSQELLAQFCPGYQKTPEAVLAQLRWLAQHYEINTTIAAEIRRRAIAATAD